MSLLPENHIHHLRHYKHKNLRQWNCITPFCKFFTRQPLDIFGQIITCTNLGCGKVFRFEKEDLKQTEDIWCPECYGTDDPRRVVEMALLNDIRKIKTIEVMNTMARDPQSINEDIDVRKVEDIVTANLLKDLIEEESK